MAASPSGFALRLNGSEATCLSQEVDCGRTVQPFRVCCPERSFCPSQYNVNCCPSVDNCTTSLVENPRCANETWDLYDNDGYFCCLKGLLGYAARLTGSSGCGSEGYILQSGEVRLPLVKAGTAPTTVSLLTSSTSSASSTTSIPPSSTPSPSQENDNPESPSSGAKIGIGIGVALGVIALILVSWLAFRHGKKKKSARAKELDASAPMVSHQHSDVKDAPYMYRPELDSGNYAPAELAGHHNHPPPVELDGQRR